MIRRYVFLIFLQWPLAFSASGQLSVKSLNSGIDYANQSAEEVEAVFSGIKEYYPKLFIKNSWNQPRYTCPVQLDEYYYKKAAADLSAAGVGAALKDLRNAAEEIDRKCKDLDTYHKLEDYKKDQFDHARTMVEELQSLLIRYREKQKEFNNEISKAYSKLGVTHSYAASAVLMRKELERERAFLDLWKFNLKEEVHSGWIVAELQKSISETDAAVKKLTSTKPEMKYPASSMWPSFVDALKSILEVKRSALDGYTFEARKTDKHRNDVYLSLINYYNGALLADYNTFVKFASGDNYAALKAIRYVPVFEIAVKAEVQSVQVTPFKEVPRAAISPPKQNKAIPRPVYKALINYVEFINETWRQVSHHRDVIRNLNSSAASYASLTSYEGRGGLYFAHDDLQIPYSYYQKTVEESKSLTPAVAESLNAAAQTLINILKEIDEIGAVLEEEVKAKKYQQDKVRHVYDLIERTHILFQTWDDKKERLFEDVRSIYDSYATTEPGSSWTISGTALRELTALDHEGLFKAKGFYQGKNSGPVETSRIDAKLREVIANEYDNMKGIQKYGRNNGLCPYTPYEDLPKSSRLLSEYLAALKPAKPNQDNYQHPYHSMVYVYNDVVEDYNKFCELSPVPLLPDIKQPELFVVVYPKKEEPQLSSQRPVDQPVSQTRPSESSVNNKAGVAQQPPLQSSAAKTKVVRDTVYIEKRDTIYLREPVENLRSMEGYATNNMVLLLDVSGSMNTPEKLPLLKKSVLQMLSMMRIEDRISIVVFSGKPKVLLPSTSFTDEKKIEDAINSLKPSGKTDGNAGLKLAYKVADANYVRGGNNRIVIATDGEFPVSPETETIVDKFSREDIFLSVFNFGNKSVTGKGLQKLANLGRGNYEFISFANIESKLIGEAKAKKKK